MSTTIYLIIFILFLVDIFWTWSSTKSFEGNFTRISYIFIGTLFITLLTYIIFLFSKNGINYPNNAMIGKIRNIILLTFVPINSFVVLPQLAKIVEKIKNDEISEEKLKKIILIFVVIAIFLIVIESIYFKSIQNGIISIINSK